MMMMPALLLLIAIFVGISLLGSATEAAKRSARAKRKREYDPDDYNVDLSSSFAEKPKRETAYFLTDDGEFFVDADDQ